jgi:hypothetical protein
MTDAQNSKNQNSLITNDWSNPDSKALYMSDWPNAPEYKERYQKGDQCGACSFYAKFNFDFGLCAFRKSPHYLETVFEHFTCPMFVDEGWGPHSFNQDSQYHCRCGGSSDD